MAKLSDYRFMDEKNHTYIRLLWFVVYALLSTITVGLITELWDGFLVNPTITTLESTYFPVSKIPFPGVAVCEMNKISKKRATKFAQFLAERSNLSEEEVMDAMPIFGNMYDFEYDANREVVGLKIQNVLDHLGLDLMHVLRELAPSCEDLLIVCKWKKQRRNCSELFQTRVAFNGFCCIFNYLKKIKHFPPELILEEPYKGQEGISEGLTVSINNDIEDYLYSSIYSTGYTILIFQPGDYPDQPSGSLTEIIANPNTESFLEIVPTTIVAVKDVVKYSTEKRQCLFDVERLTNIDTVYSQSDCNVECRVNSSLGLCKCVPFMLPLSTKDNVCTLTDLSCLNQFRKKWNYIFPDDDSSEFLQREKHNSLRCKERCYPSCEGTSYEVFSSDAPFHKTVSETYGNHTLVHVYYLRRFSDLYKQDVVYYWYEILSIVEVWWFPVIFLSFVVGNFGGTFGLMIGMSFVSVIECGLFWVQFINHKRQK